MRQKRTDRVKTGVPGLDKLLGGGIPRNHIVLVSGQAGSGKTIFGLQFLVNGAKKYGEKGLFVSFEQPRDDLLSQAKQLGWEWEELERKGKVKLVSYLGEKERLFQFFEDLESLRKDVGAERIVLDSLSALLLHMGISAGLELLQRVERDLKGASLPLGIEGIRQIAVREIFVKLKSLDSTVLVIAELPERTDYLSRDTVSEFLADGVILLKHVALGDTLNRNLEVRKMRHTDIQGGPRSYSITPKGIMIE